MQFQANKTHTICRHWLEPAKLSFRYSLNDRPNNVLESFGIISFLLNSETHPHACKYIIFIVIFYSNSPISI